MKLYGAEDVTQAKRMVSALVPRSVSVSASIRNRGLTLCVILQGGPDFWTYEFGVVGRNESSPGRPGQQFSRSVVLEIADEWETGRRIPKAKLDGKTPPLPIYVRTTHDLFLWQVSTTTAPAVYHTGDLATFRKTAARRIRDLDAIEDRRSGRTMLKAPLRRERQQLQEALALADAVQRLNQKGIVTLSQRRVGPETQYLAMKAAAMTINPAQLMRLQKQISSAIRAALDPHVRAGEFKILAIGFEGEEKIQNVTAKVEVYKSSPHTPIHFRIPITDLGEDAAQWPSILKNKVAALKKLIRSREGREPVNTRTKQLME